MPSARGHPGWRGRKLKRKATHSTPGSRLAQAVPECEQLLDLAFARGDSAGSQTAQLLKLLDLHGAPALRLAVAEAIARNTPHASAVAFVLRKRKPSTPPLAVDLSRHPWAQAVDIQAHDLEIYDELARTKKHDGSDK